MRVLIEGDNLAGYFAKCHEAFRTGLRAMFDARCFGKGYPYYWPTGPLIQTYGQMTARMFPGARPDVLLAEFHYESSARKFLRRGLADVNTFRATILGDYWDVSENYRDQFVQIMLDHGVDMVLSYFPQPLKIWGETEIGEKLVYMPPAFDPAVFNDWQQPKLYDVGFLAAGTAQPHPLYPERHAIHQQLLKRRDLRYLWAQHPGTGWFPREHPLIGKGFSRAINSCKLFITTGGKHRNAHAKYVEIMASRSLLLAERPTGAAALGLRNGVNYVRINAENVMEKIEYYLARPELAAAIAQRGYETAMRMHNCYTRALQFQQAFNTLKAKQTASRLRPSGYVDRLPRLRPIAIPA